MISAAPFVTKPVQASAPKAPHSWWSRLGRLAAVLAVLVALGAMTTLLAERPFLFDDYRAGYDGLMVTSDMTGQDLSQACGAAGHSRYPDLFETGGDWTGAALHSEVADAFYAGCRDRWRGRPANIWNVSPGIAGD